MAHVTSIYWTCPGCGSTQEAQVLGVWSDNESISPDAVPTDRGGLRWNPPCKECGKFRLVMPPTIACTPQRVTTEPTHEQ